MVSMKIAGSISSGSSLTCKLKSPKKIWFDSSGFGKTSVRNSVNSSRNMLVVHLFLSE